MQHAELNGRYTTTSTTATTTTSLTSMTRILPSTVLELNKQMNNAVKNKKNFNLSLIQSL
jgi:hypothetical protein